MAEIGIGQRQFAGVIKPLKGCLRLDRQLVERQMIAGNRQRLPEFRLPRRKCLIGPRIDEIERRALKCSLRNIDGTPRLGDRVNASERAQIVIAQGLHADRNTIDASRAISGKASCIHAARIGFKRYLGIRRERKQPVDVFDECCHRRWLHQRRRAAAKKYGLCCALTDTLAHTDEFPPIGREIGRFIPPAMPDMAVEVAIRTFLGAERPVDVNCKRRCLATIQNFLGGGGHDTKQLETNFSNARALCEIACLASGSISPNVSVPPSGMNMGS